MFKINGVTALKPVEGSVRRTEVEEVQYPMNHMKIRKTSGLFEVAKGLFRTDGYECWKFLTYDTLFKDKVPDE